MDMYGAQEQESNLLLSALKKLTLFVQQNNFFSVCIGTKKRYYIREMISRQLK